MTTLRAEAFAKTNLTLRIVGKRPDGYHEIDTLFQTIDLTDSIEVSPARSAIDFACSEPSVPSGEGNLVHRAASRWKERFGVAEGARIRLEKRIPVGGGLGGGSSDAAVALVLLSRLWRLSPGPRDFAEVGAALGSDVPFFFLGGTARGRGRGEIVDPLPDAPPRRLVLVVPPFSIATRDVYARWHRGPVSKSAGSVFGENELASAVLDVNPEMDRYRQAISRYFPDFQISGSGASLIAVDSDAHPEGVESLAAELRGARILRTRTVSRPEYEGRSTVDSAIFQRR